MTITATHINYFQVCRRKLWLFSHGLNMEHTSDIVTEGRIIGEKSYPQRAERYTELQLDGVKIDFYDAKNKVVHETKKSDKVEAAHEAQVKYYLWKLEQNGVAGATGIIEYPKQRHTAHIAALTDADRKEIVTWEREIMQIVECEQVPSVINAKICKTCSYFEFCYAG
jgi:CRISPR-associated exonuclease Cas4